jgi:DNA-binding MarR family transcriptional regulator
MNPIAPTELAERLAGECIAFRVRVLNRVITNLYDAVLKPFGITVNQTTILAMLTLAGEVTPGEIGRELVMEKSTVSRNLERMRKNGWIETGAQGIRVTGAGQALFTSLHPAWEEAQTNAEGLLGAAGIGAILGLHQTMRGVRQQG